MKRLALLLLLATPLSFSQTLMPQWSPGLFARVPGPGGKTAAGGGTPIPALVSSCHGIKQGGGGATTTAVDCTGAVGYIAATSMYAGNACTAGTVTDSNGDTWLHWNNYAFNSEDLCIQYSCGVTGTTGFTVHYPPAVAGVAFAGFTNLPSLCADTSIVNGAGSAANPISTGSVTPSASGYLLAIAVTSDTTSASPTAMTITTTCGLTWAVTDFLPLASGVGLATGLAYAVQSSVAPCNPAVTVNGGANNVVEIASFKHS